MNKLKEVLMVGASRTATDERKAQAEDAIVLGLLDAVDGNPTITQRHLAQELGVALGLTNTYLKRCIRKGLLKVTEIPTRRYAYYVTPQGFAEKSRLTARYLTSSFGFLRRARNELGELFEEEVQRGQSRFALIGTGDLADVAMLVAPRANIEILAVVSAETDPVRLTASLHEVDFGTAVITATEFPQQVFAAAIEAFGSTRVRAPKLLRIKLAKVDERANSTD